MARRTIIATLKSAGEEPVTIHVARADMISGTFEVYVEGGALSQGEDTMSFNFLHDALKFAADELATAIWQVA